MKNALAFFALIIAVSCANTTAPAPIVYHTVTITANIERGDNPYLDLFVIVPVDSIIRSYTVSTVDTIVMQHGNAITFLWYTDGLAANHKMQTVRVTRDIDVLFDNGITVTEVGL